jgi:hypothetical protein
MPLKFFAIVRAAAAKRMIINGSVCQVSSEVVSKSHLRPNGPPECVADCAFSIGLRLTLVPDLRF